VDSFWNHDKTSFIFVTTHGLNHFCILAASS
jgi:hypothetical protein